MIRRGKDLCDAIGTPSVSLDVLVNFILVHTLLYCRVESATADLLTAPLSYSALELPITVLGLLSRTGEIMMLHFLKFLLLQF